MYLYVQCNYTVCSLIITVSSPCTCTGSIQRESLSFVHPTLKSTMRYVDYMCTMYTLAILQCTCTYICTLLTASVMYMYNCASICGSFFFLLSL